jgi:hypothetical protein
MLVREEERKGIEENVLLFPLFKELRVILSH